METSMLYSAGCHYGLSGGSTWGDLQRKSYGNEHWVKCANCGSFATIVEKDTRTKLMGVVQWWWNTVKYQPAGPTGDKLDAVYSTIRDAYVDGENGELWYDYVGLA